MVRRKNNSEELFVDYYDNWVNVYKAGAVRGVTLDKYLMQGKFLRRNFPDLKIADLDRRTYQNILNKYAETHEKATTIDFHHQVKASIKDLFYDGKIDRDPTYKAIIKGKAPSPKKQKYLQKDELLKLIRSLDLSHIGRDWLILLIAKTGMRYSEALAVTPRDFNGNNNTLKIDKTWEYKKTNAKFQPTKNASSVRTIPFDWQIAGQFLPMIVNLPLDEPIFVEKDNFGKYKRIFNSTINNYLGKKCRDLGITEISMHALRHTHASVLLSAGVSIHTISKRLGHSTIQTTQETYTHIIDALREQDDQKMMGALMALGTGA